MPPTTGYVVGTSSNDVFDHFDYGQVWGRAGNDTLTLTAGIGYAADGIPYQIHAWGEEGDDTLNLSFRSVATPGGYRLGHHVRGDNEERDGNEITLGEDTFNFVDINNVQAGNVAVGRLEDFDASRDTIQIEGVTLNLQSLPSNVRIVEYNGTHDQYESSEPQQWLLITNSVGGRIFYALEGARVDMDPTIPGAGHGGMEEAHFIPWTSIATVDALPDVAFIDKQNFIPAGYTKVAGGLYINDGDANNGRWDQSGDPTVQENVLAVVQGGGGHDLIAAGQNNDMVQAGGGADTVWGGSGYDTLYGGTGNDSLMGGTGNDLLRGEGGLDILDGGLGDDTIFGEAGNDIATGGDGQDVIHGGAGHDTLSGNVGNDTLFGNGGNDSLAGGWGNDYLDGGLDNDVLSGWDGNDTLLGAAGNDTLFGENGNDLLNGGDGADSLLGGIGNDTVLGETGDDTLNGEDGLDSLGGGDGADLVLGGNGNDTLHGGAGNDHLQGNVDNDTLYGDAGNDLLEGGWGDDYLDGGDDHDFLSGWDGSDTLLGGNGNDTFQGGNGHDYLNGGSGADALNGGAGRDTLYGGGGRDVFDGGSNDLAADVYRIENSWESQLGAGNRDQFLNFELGRDKIDLTEIDANWNAANDQGFSFAGIVPTAHSIWYVSLGGDLLIRGDMSGDGVEDFEFEADGLNAIGASDFIL